MAQSYVGEYLESLGCELWPGVTFYLTDDAERAKAEQWMRDTLAQMELHRIQNFNRT